MLLRLRRLRAARPSRPRLGVSRHSYAESVADVEIVFSVSESPEGGYEAKALGHSIHTQAETLDELRAAVQDAVRCHFDEAERPSLIRLHMVRDEVIPA